MQKASIQFDMTGLQESIVDAVKQAVGTAFSQMNLAKTDSYPEFMNKGEAAKFLGVSRNTLEKWIIDEGLPVSVIGGTYRFTKADLLAFMASHKVKKTGCQAR